MPVPPVDVSLLCRRCDEGRFAFETTAALEPLQARIGQERAAEALAFGVSIRHEGYNLYAMGPAGSGKHTAVRALLEARAAREPTPADVVYVHNFVDKNEPRALLLPPGTGRKLASDVRHLVEELRTVIPGALEGEQVRARKQRLEEEAKQRHNHEFTALRDKAAQKNIALVHTPFGFALAPMKAGEVLEPEVFSRLPEEEREGVKREIEALGGELQALIAQVPRWEAEVRKKVRDLVQETILVAVGHLVDDAQLKYDALPEVVAYLGALRDDVLESFTDFIKTEDGPPNPLAELSGLGPFRRYQVNLLVDNEASGGAPVVYEDHPTADKLVGRIEHLSQLGALVTDFGLIKPGALHRANGGYLILDARNMVMQPYAWEALKRSLHGKQIRIEPLAQMLGLISTVTIEPQPVPLAVKVVLLGDRQLFYLMGQVDPDFRALFKVAVDFEDEVARTDENDLAYARLVATVTRDEHLAPFDRSGVGRVIERCARLAEDSERLSAHMGQIIDLLREADHWARQRGAAVVSGADVDHAVAAEDRREGRVRERVLEEIQRGTLLIETSGEKVGQVNGLSVLQLGRASFGRPSRITARVRMGRGEVLDIEREVELGGPIHSKGVLILSGFLGARYAEGHPLSLSATLAFEQSYGMVEGDSASSAELYALLSALSGVPIQQSFAVTGSVNQHGEVQAIGGVNEKIEGFFDVCGARGLTGRQGVLIPASNVKHLMLRADVVEAVRGGRFGVWAVHTIDEGIERLTGLPAGERDASGAFPEASINGKVEARLVQMAKERSAAAEGTKASGIIEPLRLVEAARPMPGAE
jgi:lon-related putative ATP-dependent protease